MIKEISNNYIKLRVDTIGAQIKSLVMKDYEYMWQGDSKYWGKTAPNLFPFIARLYESKYSYRGKEYPMESHGFLREAQFELSSIGSDYIELKLSDSSETRKIYPFEFTIKFRYTLIKNKVSIKTTVINNGNEVMHFSLGGHPGFNTPLLGATMKDYYLEFDSECKPNSNLMNESFLINGKKEEFKLRDNKYLDLSHELFDSVNTIMLDGMAKGVSLKSKKSSRVVHLEYPDMKYLAIWQSPNKKSPYLCLEPWSSLQGNADTIMDIENSNNYIHLDAKEEYINSWSIEVE